MENPIPRADDSVQLGSSYFPVDGMDPVWKHRLMTLTNVSYCFQRSRYRTISKRASLGLLVISCVIAGLRLSAAEPNWDDWKGLLGTWVAADSAGAPGKANQGQCTFSLDLQSKVIVRKNHAEYPASNGRPATVHDDLMIIFQRGAATRAFYYDSEGHEINYSASWDARDKAWNFTSDAVTDAPRYRLTYIQVSPQQLKLKFEIAPPGKPDSFKTYIEASLQKSP